MPQTSDAQRLSRIFQALSSDARVRIVQLLSGDILCVGALSRQLGMTPGGVSQHLRVLRDAGLVTAEKRGYYVHYALNLKTLSRWRATIDRFMTAGMETVPGTQENPECTRKRKEDKRCVKRRKAASTRRS